MVEMTDDGHRINRFFSKIHISAEDYYSVEQNLGIILMMTRFDVWLTNEQKGAFHCRQHLEIEYSRSIVAITFNHPSHTTPLIIKSCF